MDLNKLLERINYVGSIDEVSLKLLNELCISIVSSIPYETLDNFGGKQQQFGLQIIYDKIVNDHRGGNCIDLNIILHWMLSKIGFNVEMCISYGIDKKSNSFIENSPHMCLLVTFDDGQRWLTDVGFGGMGFVFPLEMNQLAVEQYQPNGIYRIRRYDDDIFFAEKKRQTQLDLHGSVISSRRFSTNRADSEWNILYGFSTKAMQLEDIRKIYLLPGREHAFTSVNCVAILQDTHHRRFLTGSTFIKKQYIDPMTIQVVHLRQLDKNELNKILQSEFGIVLNFELRPRSELTWIAG
uniref:arylamine N-acetyltransferase 2-like n=1 Tax=Styela clava TaxID=7725 RepID=UPI00193AA204|nr:arylamine N-acetyltransferase 2-like [Styela clava]